MRPARLAFAVLLAGCPAAPTAKLATPAPGGFATFTDEARAVSAKGVVYRVREVANEPPADLAFWREALKKRMLDAGYAFVAEEPLAGAESEGHLLELAAPVGSADFGYLVGIYVRGERIVIAEAGGDLLELRAVRAQVVEAMRGIRVAPTP